MFTAIIVTAFITSGLFLSLLAKYHKVSSKEIEWHTRRHKDDENKITRFRAERDAFEAQTLAALNREMGTFYIETIMYPESREDKGTLKYEIRERTGLLSHQYRTRGWRPTKKEALAVVKALQEGITNVRNVD